MKKTLKFMALALVAGGTMFAQTRFSVGIHVGGYGAPPVYAAAYRPPCPGPGYAWVDGYWGFDGGRRVWIDGFWRAPEPVIVHRDYYRDDYRRYDRDDYRRNDRDDRWRHEYREHREDRGHDYRR